GSVEMFAGSVEMLKLATWRCVVALRFLRAGRFRCCEGKDHGQAFGVGRTVGTHRTADPQARIARREGGPTSDRGACCADGNRVCAENGHSLGGLAAG